MMVFAQGAPDARIGPDEARAALAGALQSLGPRKRVLVLPPDITRLHSQAGLLAEAAWDHYGSAVADVMPALGTHAPMTAAQVAAMFGRVPPGLFRVHDWRGGLTTLGHVPGDLVRDASGGVVDYSVPVQVNRLLTEGRHDLILSIGQVVPHEVAGMAGHDKNIFVGVGGADAIHRTHFLGAAFGMERIMGRAANPVRRVLRYAAETFARSLPIVHVLTVVGRDADGALVLRGIFIGDDGECFRRAAALALQVNVEMVDRPLAKVVVWLDPAEYRTTWLGNKSIYRTRMAIADGGELIVLAPGVERFGEDAGMDALIRRFGYAGTPAVLSAAGRDPELARNLAAAAHLIHGSPEGRFTVTYCPGRLRPDEVEGVGFRWADLAATASRYDPRALADGPNILPDGEEIFFVSNPGLGLWACRERFGPAPDAGLKFEG